MKINGVFEGGGVKGIALAGGVSAAMKQGHVFNEVAGTSSGAIVAALLAAGYTGEDMKEMILRSPFRSFMQRSPIFNTKIIGPAARLVLKKGLYSGAALEDWVSQQLAAKGIRTFGDLRHNQLRVIASDITQGKLLILPDDIAQYGIDPRKFSIAKAVRMSTSIPYFFDPVMIRRKLKSSAKAAPFAEQFYYIVDGGLLSNYPLWVFDQETDREDIIPVIGFQLVGKSDISTHKIKGPITMLEALFGTMLSAHDERYIEQKNRFRTVKIPTLGVGNTQFNLSKELSMSLYDSGFQASNDYFNNWSAETYEQNYEKLVLRR
ncbi:patatin-like phospholipase family protein [Paenibacillus alginolyticus]|uniref:Patatin-like phospholipase family protein n=1 Tax=Paenibacillus alginolyticus TaxID=59839 RepID=A0ABT4GK18_9BACL|nr:patatin-like phospholipase family protein [Paenibacillus alginolyticus]MCY9696523.1 patatin-like phospholipase family protein [Paenibacillus alginolyticus]MEC0148612.1 patatin-like phospholipase family protein [Paenibacillus alginolyticus]